MLKEMEQNEEKELEGAKEEVAALLMGEVENPLDKRRYKPLPSIQPISNIGQGHLAPAPQPTAMGWPVAQPQQPPSQPS